MPPSLLMSGVFKLICGRKMKRFDDESRTLLRACCGADLSERLGGGGVDLNLFGNRI